MPYYDAVETIIEGVKDTAKTAISGIPLTQPKPSPLSPQLPPLHLARSPLLQGKHSYNPQQRVIFPQKNVAVPEFRTAAQAYSV
ncbi:hypothetical protein [Oscillatoria acuminata]|uniref:Uncharacterized protein n=1 Tax=Oscillatoria acuminata PCC 6304 TaxID=56110 RepID=K9TE11_9CYAN|nr:hypothetical protein [Oscillatoria acuminata]AFY81117.1 hypothetical protein Oscil6304_1410 [Oscillatoria acuminata PCC 6304]